MNIGGKHLVRLHGIFAGKAGGAESAFCVLCKLDNMLSGKVAQRIGPDHFIDLLDRAAGGHQQLLIRDVEIMNTEHLPLFENVDLIQVGARNMQNFELLKAVGRQKKPVLLKRGLANTLEEFVMSAEYIMAEGNENVILCERGIRTFETSMRNTLDLAGVVMLHKMTHLPVIVDPSHACGHAWMVPDLAKAAVAAGADGLMIEVHNNPAKAKCDGAQSLTPDQFDELMQFIGKEVEFFGKKLN